MEEFLTEQAKKFIDDFLAYNQRQIYWKKDNNKAFSEQEIRYFKWISKGFEVLNETLKIIEEQQKYIELIENELFVLKLSNNYLQKNKEQKQQIDRLRLQTDANYKEYIRSKTISNSQIKDKW